MGLSKGFKHSEITKRKMSEGHKRSYKENPQLSKQMTKHLRYIAEFGGKALWGKHPKSKEQMSELAKLGGLTHSIEHLRKIGKLGAEAMHKKYPQNGNLNSNWKGGISKEPYPFEWTEIFKKAIRQRDNHKCQLCGISEFENGRKLDIHHIDYKKNNLDPNNLISLCCHCHMKTNGNRKYWEEKLRKHQPGREN